MEHDAHLSEDVDRGGLMTKLVAAGIVALILVAVAVYVVYGSGMWHTDAVTHI